jgi:hypothetical protein
MAKRTEAQKRRRRATTLRRQARAWLDRLPPTTLKESCSALGARTDRALDRLEKEDPELRRAVSDQIWKDLARTLAKDDRFFARWLREAKKRAAARAPRSARWRRQAAVLARL